MSVLIKNKINLKKMETEKLLDFILLKSLFCWPLFFFFFYFSFVFIYFESNEQV